MPEEKEYCCELMQRAIVYSHEQSMKMRATHRPPLPGLMQAYVFTPKGSKLGVGSPIVYAIPAYGRGKARVLALNMVINYCPFCGTEHAREHVKINQTIKIQLPEETPKTGVVAYEDIRRSPGLQLGARYHLKAGPKPYAQRNGRRSRQ